MVGHGNRQGQCGLVLSTVLVAAGCACLSPQQAEVERERLYARNRDRAEPAMRSAAGARGAALLAINTANLALPLDCGGEDSEPPSPVEGDHDTCRAIARSTHSCASWATDRRTFVLRQQGAGPKLVIPIADDGSSYTRLARRGNTLLILHAKRSTRTIGRAVECECDGMPKVSCPSTYGFIVDDVFAPQIEEVWVPVTEDQLDWSCKAWAV